MTLLFALLLGIAFLLSVICRTYVAFALKNNGTLTLTRALFSGRHTFLYGWKEAQDLGLIDIMAVWSVSQATLMIAVCVVATMLMNMQL